MINIYRSDKKSYWVSQKYSWGQRENRLTDLKGCKVTYPSRREKRLPGLGAAAVGGGQRVAPPARAPSWLAGQLLL